MRLFKMRMAQRMSALAVALLALTACGGSDGDGGLPDAGALCGSIGLQPKITNGANCSTPDRSPVILLAVVRGGSVQTCSGVLLTPTQVLTAGHCLQRGTSRVAAGLWQADGTVVDVRAASWTAHPGFAEVESGFVNDVGVVNLSAPLPNPTMPLLVSQPSAPGDEVFLAGWGAPGFELAVGFARLTIVNPEQIGFVYSGALSNSCVGDSGGPAYRSVGGRQAVVGLTSSGTVPNCGPGDRSLFTNIQGPSVLGFIRAQVPGAAEI